MTSLFVQRITAHKDFSRFCTLCSNDSITKNYDRIVKWLFTKHFDLTMTEMSEVLEEMGIFTSDEIEEIIASVHEKEQASDSNILITRLLQKHKVQSRREIISSLTKKHNIKQAAVYRMLALMVQKQEVFLHPNKLYSLRPFQSSSPIKLSHNSFVSAIKAMEVGKDILPFAALNKAIRGINSSDSLLYLAPGNKGKTTFLFQVMMECCRQKIDTLYLATIEGDIVSMGASISSMLQGRRVDVDELPALYKRVEAGDRQAIIETTRIAEVFSQLECWHYQNNALSVSTLIDQVNDYKRLHSCAPKVIIFDYLKASYVASQDEVSYGTFAKAIEEIIGFCRSNNITFITASQDPGQTERKKDSFDYPEAPSLYGARNATDAFQIVLWQQGSVVNPVNHVALNRIKIHKVKRGDRDSYVITSVDTNSYRALDSKGPFFNNEDRNLLNQAEAQRTSGVDLSGIDVDETLVKPRQHNYETARKDFE